MLVIPIAGLTACSSAPTSGESFTNSDLLDPGPIAVGDDGSVRVDTSDGPVQFGAGRLPAGWPLPTPDFPGAGLDAAFGTGKAFTLSYSAPSDILGSVAAYVDALVATGYPITDDRALGEGARTWELANDTWQVSITAGYTDGETTILMLVGAR